MAECIDYNCADNLGDHVLNDCGYERQGGASWMVLIACGSTIADPSDGTEINALIAAGNAWLVKNINVSYDRATPVEVDANVPCDPSRVVNYERQFTCIDRNVSSNNNTFWDVVFAGRRFGGAIIGECANEDDQNVKFIDATITATGSDRLPNTNNEFQDYEGIFKWRSLKMPSIHVAPTGVV